MAIIRTKTNPKDAAACQVKFERIWRQLQDDFTPELEKQAIALYEECSKYSPQCPVCVAGRAEFQNSLNQLRAGNVDAALKAFGSSFKTVKFKLYRLRSAWFGNG